jgi:hypothetical protein
MFAKLERTLGAEFSLSPYYASNSCRILLGYTSTGIAGYIRDGSANLFSPQALAGNELRRVMSIWIRNHRLRVNESERRESRKSYAWFRFAKSS